MALTIKLGSGRRKRRALGGLEDGSCEVEAGSISGYYGCHLHNFVWGGEEGSYWQQAADLLWHGEYRQPPLPATVTETMRQLDTTPSPSTLIVGRRMLQKNVLLIFPSH